MSKLENIERALLDANERLRKENATLRQANAQLMKDWGYAVLDAWNLGNVNVLLTKMMGNKAKTTKKE